MDVFLNPGRLKDLLCVSSCFLEVFPTFIVDGNQHVRFECMENLHSLTSIESKSHWPQDGKSCRADMQNRRPDLEALTNLTQSVEPDRITGDIQRAMFLPRPLQNEPGSFTHHQVTSQCPMVSRRGGDCDFDAICLQRRALPGFQPNRIAFQALSARRGGYHFFRQRKQ